MGEGEPQCMPTAATYTAMRGLGLDGLSELSALRRRELPMSVHCKQTTLEKGPDLSFSSWALFAGSIPGKLGKIPFYF